MYVLFCHSLNGLGLLATICIRPSVLRQLCYGAWCGAVRVRGGVGASQAEEEIGNGDDEAVGDLRWRLRRFRMTSPRYGSEHFDLSRAHT